MALSYDITGLNERFVKSETFCIHKEHQQIKLAFPAYLNVPVAGSSAGSGTYFKVVARIQSGDAGSWTEIELTKDTSDGKTYTLVASEEDDQVKSDAIVAATNNPDIASTTLSNFDPTIVNYLKINAFGDADNQVSDTRFQVVVTYHRVRCDQLEVKTIPEITGEYDGDGPRYSPALMSKVLTRLDALESSGSSSVSLFGTAMGSDDILEEDITGLAPENYVEYEKHDVNTSAGINLIQPSKGSFYPSNLKVIVYNPTRFTLTYLTKANARGKLFIYSDTEDVIDSSSHISTEYKVILTDTILNNLVGASADNGKKYTGYIVDLASTSIRQLTAGVDYTLDAIDIPRTARSTSNDGVYQNIRFITALTGEVLISYQAFGGMVATADIRKLHQDVTNTRTVLQNTDLLTAEALGKQPIVKELNRRLRRVEEYHNHFEQVEHRVSVSDPGFHWFSIAAIYDVEWGTALSMINDIGQFRIQSALHKWVFEFMVDVDLSRRAGDELHVKTLGTNQDAGYNPDNYSKILFRDNIAVRICWVNNGNNSGVVLQIGWDFRSYHSAANTRIDYMVDTDTIIVTNKSGSSSMWTLMHDPDVVNYSVAGLIDVWSHNEYKQTTDTTYQSGKRYYVYRDTYIYVRTADKYFVEGKNYFTYSSTGVDDGYTQVLTSTNPNVAPGKTTSIFNVDDGSGNLTLNLFERVLFGHYAVPAQIAPTAIGTNITGVVYELTEATYQDDSFTMPNKELVWINGETTSNCCVKMIEPEDGIIAWLGNVSLAQFAPNFGRCTSCPDNANNPSTATATTGTPGTFKAPLLMFSSHLHTNIEIDSIRAVSMVVFDRRDGKYINVHANTSLSKTAATCELAYCLEDMCFASIEITKETEGSTRYCKEKITPATSDTSATYGIENLTATQKLLFLNLKTFMGTMSLKNDRFDLRQIRLHF